MALRVVCSSTSPTPSKLPYKNQLFARFPRRNFSVFLNFHTTPVQRSSNPASALASPCSTNRSRPAFESWGVPAAFAAERAQDWLRPRCADEIVEAFVSKQSGSPRQSFVVGRNDRHPCQDPPCANGRPPAIAASDEEDRAPRAVVPRDLSPRLQIDPGWRRRKPGMCMPLPNKCVSAPALGPSPVGETLMSGIVSIKPQSCAAVAPQRQRTVGDLDMRASIAADQDPSGLCCVLGNAQVAIDPHRHLLVDDDESHAGAEDH
ncbi:hypothetical protein ACVIGB_008333 [Bradyrhizobium sp. USDA 4341]